MNQLDKECTCTEDVVLVAQLRTLPLCLQTRLTENNATLSSVRAALSEFSCAICLEPLSSFHCQMTVTRCCSTIVCQTCLLLWQAQRKGRCFLCARVEQQTTVSVVLHQPLSHRILSQLCTVLCGCLTLLIVYVISNRAS